MYWKKERETEIAIIQQAISDNAFRKIRSTLYLVTKKRPPYPKFDDISKKNISFESFTYKVSTNIWKLIQHTQEDEKNNFIEAVKSQIEEDLKTIQTYLTSQYACEKDKPQVKGKIRYYALRKIIKICRSEFEMCLNRQNFSKDVKGFLRYDPGSPAWQTETEQQFIVAIRKIYIDHLSLKPENITFNMSKVFEAANLWPKKNYYETMRKRIRALSSKSKNLS